jgi:hypothetical protein
MKKLIRSLVFETNSSSAHCITLPETMELLDTILPNSIGEIILTGGDYGFSYNGRHVFTDALTKANYMAVYAKCYSTTPEESVKFLNDVIRMQTGARKIVYNFFGYYDTDDYLADVSYIDHDSTDKEYFDVLFGNPTHMLNFLFNPRANLVIKSDGSNAEEHIRNNMKGQILLGW